MIILILGKLSFILFARSSPEASFRHTSISTISICPDSQAGTAFWASRNLHITCYLFFILDNLSSKYSIVKGESSTIIMPNIFHLPSKPSCNRPAKKPMIKIMAYLAFLLNVSYFVKHKSIYFTDLYGGEFLK